MDHILLSTTAAAKAPISEEDFTPADVDHENPPSENALTPERDSSTPIALDETEFVEEEIEEELIIEDFTIDGICGVY